MKINCNTPTRVGSSLGHDTTCEGQGASTYRPERTEGLCKDTETRVPRFYTHTPPTHRYTHTYTHIFLGAPGCTPRSAVSEVTHPPADRGRPCLASLPRGRLNTAHMRSWLLPAGAGPVPSDQSAARGRGRQRGEDGGHREQRGEAAQGFTGGLRALGSARDPEGSPGRALGPALRGARR